VSGQVQTAPMLSAEKLSLLKFEPERHILQGRKSASWIDNSASYTPPLRSILRRDLILFLAPPDFSVVIMSPSNHVRSTRMAQRVDTVGLIVFDASLNAIYVSATARQVICYAIGESSASDAAICELIPAEILALQGVVPHKAEATVMSGRRRYICRRLPLEHPGTSTQRAHCAIVLERISHEKLRRLLEEFNFTPRERDVVSLLLEGLTSKEIAQRLNISSHTVKGYIRFIMTKTGVTTRSGIVARGWW